MNSIDIAAYETKNALFAFVKDNGNTGLMRVEINGEQALTTYEIKNLNYLDKVLINLGLGDKAESSVKSFFTEEVRIKVLRAIVNDELPNLKQDAKGLYTEKSIVDQAIKKLFTDSQGTIPYSRVLFNSRLSYAKTS